VEHRSTFAFAPHSYCPRHPFRTRARAFHIQANSNLSSSLIYGSAGRGKRGGYRLIYVVRPTKGVIWMLTLYPKNVSDFVTVETLKMIRREIEREE
jgi:hypothetical protein